MNLYSTALFIKTSELLTYILRLVVDNHFERNSLTKMFTETHIKQLFSILAQLKEIAGTCENPSVILPIKAQVETIIAMNAKITTDAIQNQEGHYSG